MEIWHFGYSETSVMSDLIKNISKNQPSKVKIEN